MLEKKRQTEQSLKKLKRGAAKEGEDSGPSEAERIQQQLFLDVRQLGVKAKDFGLLNMDDIDEYVGLWLAVAPPD